jgi:hypothetical protein
MSHTFSTRRKNPSLILNKSYIYTVYDNLTSLKSRGIVFFHYITYLGHKTKSLEIVA